MKPKEKELLAELIKMEREKIINKTLYETGNRRVRKETSFEPSP